MIKMSKPLSATMFVLALALGLGSVLLFAGVPLGALRIVRPDLGPTTVLLWDTALSLLFFVQHSGMLRRGFRARLARFIPPWAYPAIYTIASGVALAAVVFLWQPTGRHLLVLDGLPLRVAQTGSLIGIALFLWGGLALRGFDLFGLSPIRAYLSGRPERRPVFIIRGPYRWVRHPLYSAILLLIWCCPDLTLDRLLFNILWTGWIWIGTRLEEADLVDLGTVGVLRVRVRLHLVRARVVVHEGDACAGGDRQRLRRHDSG